MSAALVRKSLEVVDSTSCTTGYKKNKKREIFSLVPDNQKFTKKRHLKGGKVETTNLLSHKNKISVTEAKKNYKTKDQILKDNRKKLKIIEKASKVKLDKGIINQIIERAVTKRPVKRKKQLKKDTKTGFTEEDFKKFEEEYMDQ